MAQIMGDPAAAQDPVSGGRPYSSAGDEGVSGRGSARLRNRVLFAGAASATLITTVFDVLDPTGTGPVGSAVVGGLLVVVMMVAPYLRGVRPFSVWWPETVGAACLLLGLLYLVMPLRWGPVRFIDVSYWTGFGFFILWMFGLSRHVGPRTGKTPWLDTLAVANGLLLALWVLLLVPNIGEKGFWNAFVEVAYPTLDAVLLTLAIHLGFRLRAAPVSLRWLIGALTLQTAIDTAFAVDVAWIGLHDGVVQAIYLLCYFGFAMGAAHPSVVDLARRPPRDLLRRDEVQASAVILLAISPAVLSSAVPDRGPLDITVRTTLVATLLALLFARLSKSLRALGRAEADSHHRATHDPLTGIANRASLLRYLDHLMHDSEDDGCVAVLFLDCDRFKHVNDTWGHEAGDTLLREVAHGLPSVLNPGDFLARHGGDEFVVVAPAATDEEALAVADRVRGFFDTPLKVVGNRSHLVTPSIGITRAALGSRVTAEDILGRADIALYEAKSTGRGRSVLYEEALAARAAEQASVGDRLVVALRAGPLDVDLQPIMGGQNYGTLFGVQALARWTDPVLGEVPAEVFMPVAERLGLTQDLGISLARAAVREFSRLRDPEGVADLNLFVAVSATQLADPGFVTVLNESCRAADLPEGRIWVTVAEGVLREPDAGVMESLTRLQRRGFRVCFDGFGTGYASLGSVSDLPVDGVKLDHCTVARLGDEAGRAQVAAVLRLVGTFGVQHVIAQDVETWTQARILLDLGCPLAQGPFAPLTAVDAAARNHPGERMEP